MATLTLKNNTGVDVPITDAGVFVPASSQDTYTDAFTIQRLARSVSLRSLVSAGTITVNNGVADLSAANGAVYLATLWSRAGFDQSPLTMALATATETSTQTVGNVTTETTIFSKTIPANTMGTDGLLRLNLSLRHAKDAGAPTITYRVKLGGVTVWIITGTTPAASATTFGYVEITAMIANKTATSQRIFGFTQVSGAAAGDSNTSLSVIFALTVGNAAAIDTTVNQTLEITAQWSAAPNRTPSVEMFYGTASVQRT